MEAKHEKHVLVYGNRNHERLTGDHETCHITDFRAGEALTGQARR